MDLIERIDRWGKVAPDRVAHSSGGRTLTYGDLLARSDALAAHLASTLHDDKSPVAIIGHKEPEMLVGFLGAVKSGRAYIPVDTSIPAERRKKIVEVAQAALTLTPEKIAAISSGGVPDPALRVGAHNPFYIIFTSGSTGEPKGVVITLDCLTTFVRWMTGEQKFFESGETFLNQAPFSFDLSVMDLYLSLATGGTLFSITKDEIANPKQLYAALGKSGVTTWVSTPSFAAMCLVERGFSSAMLPAVRRFLFCGETLAPETAAQLLDRFPAADVWNTYGPTEATVATTSVRVDRDVLEKFSPLPVGRTMPGTRIVVVGENGTPVAEGERGEIIIAGPNVSPGYLARPDLTARAFSMLDGARAYRTGDWGRFVGEQLFFEGRMDSQVKVNGYRIELGDLEANLRAVAGVRDAVVLSVEKNGRVDSLAAFVILSECGAESDFKLSLRLKAQLGEKLPAYMIPRKFFPLHAFPMTANGKADRRKLAELLRAS